MPDICDLILDDHETFRRRFAELDELRGNGGAADALARVWEPLATLLDLHAASEEELFYPRLLDRGQNAAEETSDAIADHNEIRDAVRRARRCPVGGDEWWEAVLASREANSDHMAEEEREAIPDFRTRVEAAARDDLGGRWLRFVADHAAGDGVDTADKNPEGYIARHT